MHMKHQIKHFIFYKQSAILYVDKGRINMHISKGV